VRTTRTQLLLSVISTHICSVNTTMVRAGRSPSSLGPASRAPRFSPQALSVPTYLIAADQDVRRVLPPAWLCGNVGSRDGRNLDQRTPVRTPDCARVAAVRCGCRVCCGGPEAASRAGDSVSLEMKLDDLRATCGQRAGSMLLVK
jgi:hypothetical protein